MEKIETGQALNPLGFESFTLAVGSFNKAGRHRNTVEIAVILLPATRTIGHVWKMRNPEYPRLARRDSP